MCDLINKEPKWIPCKERLPDKDGLYLVTYFSGNARWAGTDEFLIDGTEESHWKYANIIAWQPLPEPYEEQPTIDPVRNGKWIEKPNVHGVAYCSLCDYELHTNDTNYCPNCGAKMEEGDYA